MYKLCFYVPVSHLEVVKQHLFSAGAGRIGQYSHCSWEVLGEGQFMPLEGSHAYFGEKNKLEKIREYKVEMVCDSSCIEAVIAALKKVHPYEEPAYHIWKVENF